MAELKRYTSFEALKSSELTGKTGSASAGVFSDFEAFLKRLRSEHTRKKKKKSNNENQQPNQ
jgi:20S proteasome alpha/beta subunit